MLALDICRCWGHVYRLGHPGGDLLCEQRMQCARYHAASHDSFDPAVPTGRPIPYSQMLCGTDEAKPQFIPLEAR